MTRWLDRAQQDCVPYFPPVRLDIDLTHACNIRCAYCWQQAKTKSILGYDEVADVVDTIAAIWPPSICFTGGEPTIWPDFLRLVSHCADVGVEQMKLISNGVKLADPAFARSVVDAGVTSVNLSVDTLDPAKFLKLRSYPLGTLLRAVDNLLELRRSVPSLQITLASVVNREVTPEDVHGVKLLCRKHGFSFFMQTFFPDLAPPEICERFAMTAEERREFVRRLDALGGGVSFDAADPRARVVNRVENPLTEARTDRCYKGITTVKMQHDGGISFCWSTPLLGNLREKSFMEIWTSEEARRGREAIRDRRCKCNFDCDIFESLDLPRTAARRRAR
jgi:MoaA/NifB/PqqE/SkfB family radical SAM enzyme